MPEDRATLSPMSTMVQPSPLKIDVRRYLRMAEAGVFDADEWGNPVRVELIEGEILEMPPPNPPHCSAVGELNRLLIDAIPRERAIVWCQSPVVLSRFTAPQPDFVVLPPHAHRFREKLPQPADIWLAIEVADGSLAYDRGRKGGLYARSGIAEYWLLDVSGRALEIRRQPGKDGYASVRRAAVGERVAPAALPDCPVDWAAVFA
ncbi:MAG: Uma2 family endonuclease [Steroidobacteraceae bacterium]|jgi:Uma2 family endonuclease|nr:Uma2 family endonuclease [Steroidobacteraceae bacterium]